MKTELLHKLLLACGRSYRDGNHFKPVLEDEKSISVDNDLADIGLIDGSVIIAVAGSNDPVDWYKNITLDFKNELMGRILSWIEIHGHRFRPVIVTGHSRGGLEAQDIAGELNRLGYKVQAVVTFASPMIRNPVKNAGKFHHYRFVNCRDGVPGTPVAIQRLFSKCKWGHNGVFIHMNKPGWLTSWMKLSGTAKYHSVESYEKAFCKHYKIN